MAALIVYSPDALESLVERLIIVSVAGRVAYVTQA